jgi:predicted RNA binding protein YcfA (HicA-like mRNA interferase family)
MPKLMPKFARMTAGEVTALLAKYGFVLVSQKGSHQKWRNQITRRQVIVPQHQGRQLPIGTMKQLARGSGIPDEEWMR